MTNRPDEDRSAHVGTPARHALVWMALATPAGIGHHHSTHHAGHGISATATPRVAPLGLPPLDTLAKRGVELRQRQQLAQLVARTPDLGPLLIETTARLNRAFGSRATIAIDIDIDPEIENPSPHIFVVAISKLSFEEADTILDEFLAGWWADNHHRANYTVSLATEFA